MEIKFSDEQPPVAQTFKDIPVGSTFHWPFGSRCLKVDATHSYQLDPPSLVKCSPYHMNVSVFNVAEIESITLRRVK